jgi:hypothetical protein
MQQMETREAFDDARAENDLPALESLFNQVNAQFNACQQDFSILFDAAQLSASADEKNVRDTVGKMQFFEKLTDELTSLIRSLTQ